MPSSQAVMKRFTGTLNDSELQLQNARATEAPVSDVPR